MEQLRSAFKRMAGRIIAAVRSRLPKRLQARVFGRPRGFVAVETLRSTLGCAVEWLRSGETSSGAEPQTIEDELHWKFQAPYYRHWHHSDVWVARLDHGYIRGGRYALTDDHFLIEDVISAPNDRIDLDGDFATHAPLVRHETHRDVALLGTRWADSHYHWLMDVLPRAGILEDCSAGTEEIAHYAIPEAAIPQHTEALRLLGIGEERLLRLGPGDQIRVEDLIVPSLPEVRGNPNRWVCEFLRERFLAKASSDAEHPERIYVERRGKREVKNQKAVDKVLARHGIEKVRLEEHRFVAQVAMFQNAELVVGPHGAGLTNIVFASPGMKVVEIFSPNYVNVCNANIASRLDVTYSYLVGRGPRPPVGVDPCHVFEDVMVDVEQLDAWLSGFARLDVEAAGESR